YSFNHARAEGFGLWLQIGPCQSFLRDSDCTHTRRYHYVGAMLGCCNSCPPAGLGMPGLGMDEVRVGTRAVHIEGDFARGAIARVQAVDDAGDGISDCYDSDGYAIRLLFAPGSSVAVAIHGS